MKCLCAICDDDFVPHFATLLCSVARNSNAYPFLLFSNNISEENKSRLEAFAQSMAAELQIIDASGVDLSRFEVHWHWSRTVWLKLYLDELVPAGFSRILYLDSDIVVADDLSELLEMDMSGHPVAATIDPLSQDLDRKRTLRIPEDGTYYNTGCLLVDLDKWRAENLGGRIRDYSRRSGDRLTYLDQCAFNAVAWTRVLPISDRWNYLAFLKHDESVEPAIIHFAGPKPWKEISAAGCEWYFYFRAMTPWKEGMRPRSRSAIGKFLKRRIKGFRRSVMYKAGVAKYRDAVRVYESEKDARANLRNWFEKKSRQPQRQAGNERRSGANVGTRHT